MTTPRPDLRQPLQELVLSSSNEREDAFKTHASISAGDS